MQKFETGGVEPEETPFEAERIQHIQELVEDTQSHLRSWHDAKTRFATHETDMSQAYLDRAKNSFGQIVRETYADTYTLASRLASNDDMALDVTQETYMRAWRALPKFRGDSKFTTWIYRITANTAYNHLKKEKKHIYTPIDEGISGMFVDTHSSSDIEGRIQNTAEGRRIGKALEGLSPALRTVVVLRHIYDFDNKTISKELGITETAAKVRLHRALKILKVSLSTEENPEE